MTTLDGKAAFGAKGASDNIVDGALRPFMHRTDTLNYAIVLAGKNWMMMDNEEDERLLKAGDVLVQRGNNHALAILGTEPSVIAFVLIDGVARRDASEERRKSIHR